MRKIKTCLIVSAAVLLLIGHSQSLAAQDSNAGRDDSASKPASQGTTASYRLEFILSELEDGKKVNARTYSMLAQAGGVLNKLRVGARVPVATAAFRSGDTSVSGMVNTQFQYMDVGMNIDCRIQEHEGYLVLSTTIDSSNFTQPPALSASVPNQPVMHQLRVDLNTTVSLGKPALVTSVDDPSSKRQFQVQVTATRVKE